MTSTLPFSAIHFEHSHLGSDTSSRCQNIWLEDKYLPGFRAGCERFMDVGRKLQVKALRALALGMPHVPLNFFDEYHSDGDNQLRLLHCESGLIGQQAVQPPRQ